MAKIVVVGASGQGKIAVDTIEKAGEHNIVGWIDSFKPRGTQLYGYSILGSEDDLQYLMERHGISGGFIAIGVNEVRHRLSERIRASLPAFHFVNAIHPSVQVARGVSLGEGVLLMAGAVINSDSKIGDFATLSTRASVDHDSVIGDFAYLAPNVATSGGVCIGDFSFIGTGTQIIHNVRIGNHTVVGAGSTVVKDLPCNVVAHGTPAMITRNREVGDPYL